MDAVLAVWLDCDEFTLRELVDFFFRVLAWFTFAQLYHEQLGKVSAFFCEVDLVIISSNKMPLNHSCGLTKPTLGWINIESWVLERPNENAISVLDYQHHALLLAIFLCKELSFLDFVRGESSGFNHFLGVRVGLFLSW